ncbi:MAG: class I SAM-dependent methyltransferase, partial [Limisphaerales bacterium]
IRRMNHIANHNAQAWDELVRQKSGFASRVSARCLNNPDPYINIYDWLPEGVRGKRVLCLAAGGGKHGPLYAAAGAEVTVVDASQAMLHKDREMAAKHGLQIQCIQTCMTQLEGLGKGVYDLVMQPVSSCYIKEIDRLHQAVAGALKPGGLYIVQHKQPMSLQCSPFPEQGTYRVENPASVDEALPPVAGSEHREVGTLEFLHSLESLVGGLCRHGFVIEDLREPDHQQANARPGSFGHRCAMIRPYLVLKARRRMEYGVDFSTLIAS